MRLSSNSVLHSSSVIVLISLVTPVTAQSYYVGDQSTFKDNNGTASYHDGLNWLNFLSPGGVIGGSDPVRHEDANGPGAPGNGSAFFDIETDHRNNNLGNPPPAGDKYGQPTYLYFGDFFDQRTINNDKLVPGGIAKPSFLQVTSGTYTFDLGSNNGGAPGGLEIISPVGLSSLVVGGNASAATLNIKGGGMSRVASLRVGDSASTSGLGSTGTLVVSGIGTAFDVEGYSQIGIGATSGHIIVKDGATFTSHPRAANGAGFISIGNSNVDEYVLRLDPGACLVNHHSQVRLIAGKKIP